MKLILVRHGETDDNAERRLTGQLNPSLSKQGDRQAKAVAARLASLPIDAMYCSTLKRARETGDIIATHHHVEIQEHAWLQERHAGVLQGLTKAEMKSRFRQDHRAYKSTEPHQTISGGGESRDTFHQRIASGLNDLARQHQEQTVLVITHTGVLREIFNFVFQTNQNGNHLRSANGAICTFVYQRDLWSLETWGDVAHLITIGTSIEAF